MTAASNPTNAEPTRHRIEFRRRRCDPWKELCTTGSKDMANRLLAELASRVKTSFDWRVVPATASCPQLPAAPRSTNDPPPTTEQLTATLTRLRAA
jgi:hypothetical protein